MPRFACTERNCSLLANVCSQSSDGQGSQDCKRQRCTSLKWASGQRRTPRTPPPHPPASHPPPRLLRLQPARPPAGRSSRAPPARCPRCTAPRTPPARCSAAAAPPCPQAARQVCRACAAAGLRCSPHAPRAQPPQTRPCLDGLSYAARPLLALRRRLHRLGSDLWLACPVAAPPPLLGALDQL